MRRSGCKYYTKYYKKPEVFAHSSAIQRPTIDSLSQDILATNAVIYGNMK